MPNTTYLALENSFLNKLQVKESISVLVFSILIPFLIHFIPVSGNTAGAVLLPMFIAPFIAVIFFRLNVGLFAALLSPILNFLLTGNPVYGIVGLITSELFLFVLIARLLIKLDFVKYIAAPVSVIISMFICQLIFSSVSHFDAVLTAGLPGIILISLINILILPLAKKIK
jgi:hypothetical protein